MRNAIRVSTLVSLLAISWMTLAAAQQPARQTTPAVSGKTLALVGGMLLTGYEVPPIHHATVVIGGNKIVAAGPSSEITVPSGATVIDTSGRTMLPGLIDAHGHLLVLGHGAYDTWFSWIAAHGGDTMLNKVMEISAKQLLDGRGHDHRRSRRSAQTEPQPPRSD